MVIIIIALMNIQLIQMQLRSLATCCPFMLRIPASREGLPHMAYLAECVMPIAIVFYKVFHSRLLAIGAIDFLLAF